MEFERQSCAANKVGGAVSDFGPTAENIDYIFDTDSVGTSDGLFCESFVFDACCSSAPNDFRLDRTDAHFSVQDNQKKELEMEGHTAKKIKLSEDAISDFGSTSLNTGCLFDPSSSAFCFEDTLENPKTFLESMISDASTASSDSSIDSYDVSVHANQLKESLPCDLKTNLVQQLKNIREIDFSLQFCSLLIEAENLDYNDDELNQITEKFFYDLKNNEPDGIDITKVLLEVLEANESKKSYDLEYKALTSFFDHVKNSNFDCKISSKELKSISETIKRLMDLFCDTELYLYYSGGFFEEPEKSLHVLKKFILQFGSFEAHRVLSEMFDIGRAELDFSVEEKKEIGSLMIKATKYIEIFTRNFTLSIRSRLTVLDLQIRSSLQFIVDYFPTILADKNASNSIESSETFLNDLIAGFCNKKNPYLHLVKRVYCEDYIYDSDEDEKDLRNGGLERMPENHKWWENCMEIFFKK